MNGGVARAVFAAAFVLVAALGFAAARWRPAGPAGDHLEEWGLGGRRFGTWITWFLLGGDFYTAYTVIAVPALVYATGAGGFFALPYTILVYPIVFAVMPRLWEEAAGCGGATAADLVRHRHRDRRWGRALELAVAATGILATMPYIALQLLGMGVAIRALGLAGEAPLLAAFAVLALYTYVSGLRAPALIAFAKDIMIGVVVLAAVAVIPVRLGGYGAMFAAAGRAFAQDGGPGNGTGLLLGPGRMLPFASLALGSAGAAFLYPHTLTGILAASGTDTIRRNAVLLPAYTVLLGLVAMLGYMARAAGVHASGIDVVPALFGMLFAPWFAGFALAAIAVAALVPAAVMSIGAANLFARNVWAAWRPNQAPAEETRVARYASLAVKLGALACILGLPTRYAIDLQLLGGIWILQTLPAVMLGAFTRRFGAGALLAGWAAGFAGGSALFLWRDRLSPLHALHWGGATHEIYTGLPMLALNLAVVLAVNALAPHKTA